MQEKFVRASEHNYKVLKKAIIDFVNEADNKEYAINYCKSVWLQNNQMIPYHTIFFKVLESTFIHYSMLNRSTAISRTLEFLPEIRQKSEQGFLFTKELIENNRTIYRSDLPDTYRDFLSDENNSFTIHDLVEMERTILSFTDENIIASLALYDATVKLLTDIDHFFTAEQKETIDTTPKKGLTLNQKILLYHYLMLAGDIIPRVNTDVSVCAEIFHVLTDTPLTSIANSEIYKKLLNPLNNTQSKKTIENLNVVKQYFYRINHVKILREIDKDINDLQRNPDQK